MATPLQVLGIDRCSNTSTSTSSSSSSSSSRHDGDVGADYYHNHDDDAIYHSPQSSSIDKTMMADAAQKKNATKAEEEKKKKKQGFTVAQDDHLMTTMSNKNDDASSSSSSSSSSSYSSKVTTPLPSQVHQLPLMPPLLPDLAKAATIVRAPEEDEDDADDQGNEEEEEVEEENKKKKKQEEGKDESHDYSSNNEGRGVPAPPPPEPGEKDLSPPQAGGPSTTSTANSSTSTTPTEAPVQQQQPSFPTFKTPVKTMKSAVPWHMRGERYQRERHNSTNTVLVPNTVHAPNLEDLVRCMSSALCYHIERCTTDGKEHKYYEIFDETLFPLTKARNNTKDIPDVNTVWSFLMPVFTSERLGAEVCIMTLAYIERVMTYEDLALLPKTWRRIALGSLILASKVWEDQSVWNVDFVHCFDSLTTLDLNKLERMFLNLVQFNVGLKASLYVKYFIELQNYSPQQRRNPYNPGDQAAAALEVITIGKQKEMKKMSARRTASASDIPFVHK